MFTFAHISDIHLGPLPHLTLRQLMSKRITGFVNWHRNRRKHLFDATLDLLVNDIEARRPDHIAVTGDLVNLGTGAEIAAAAQWLRNLGDPADVTVVPGNHDAYVPGARDRAVAAWYPFIRGDDDPQEWRSDAALFPTLRRRGPVAIIGCSTANATPPFAASGFFCRRQAQAVTELLQRTGREDRFRIVLIHHPPIYGAVPPHKRLIGIRRFAAAIATGGAELVLHGHSHLNSVNFLADGTVPVIGIASASQGPGGTKPRAAYNLFSLSRHPGGGWRLACERRSLDEAGRTFETTVRLQFPQVAEI